MSSKVIVFSYLKNLKNNLKIEIIYLIKKS